MPIKLEYKDDDNVQDKECYIESYVEVKDEIKDETVDACENVNTHKGNTDTALQTTGRYPYWSIIE